VLKCNCGASSCRGVVNTNDEIRIQQNAHPSKGEEGGKAGGEGEMEEGRKGHEGEEGGEEEAGGWAGGGKGRGIVSIPVEQLALLPRVRVWLDETGKG